MIGFGYHVYALFNAPCNSLKKERTPFCLMLGVAVWFFSLAAAAISDSGHSVGVELRKAVADGWPVENVVGFDIVKGKY